MLNPEHRLSNIMETLPTNDIFLLVLLISSHKIHPGLEIKYPSHHWQWGPLIFLLISPYFIATFHPEVKLLPYFKMHPGPRTVSLHCHWQETPSFIPFSLSSILLLFFIGKDELFHIWKHTLDTEKVPTLKPTMIWSVSIHS